MKAVERMSPMKAALITLPDSNTTLHYPGDESDEDPDVYAAQQRTTEIQSKRKEVLDGVYPPPRPKGNYKPMPNPQLTPVDVDQPMFDPNDDNAIMEDNGIAGKKGPKPTPTSNKDSNEAPKKIARNPCKSDITTYVKPMDILNKILNAPVTLAAGEIIAVCKEMSTMLQDAIKPKTQSKPVNLVAMSFASKICGILIRLRVFCDGKRIDTILDTGSMLNVCSKKVWKGTINWPMDITKGTSMNDANGGEGTLTGLV